MGLFFGTLTIVHVVGNSVTILLFQLNYHELARFKDQYHYSTVNVVKLFAGKLPLVDFLDSQPPSAHPQISCVEDLHLEMSKINKTSPEEIIPFCGDFP